MEEFTINGLYWELNPEPSASYKIIESAGPVGLGRTARNLALVGDAGRFKWVPIG